MDDGARRAGDHATRTGPGSSTTATAPSCAPRAEAEGIGWITRSADWEDMPRHAKAGNLNNALLADRGRVPADPRRRPGAPSPTILDRTLGYFTDERMALVQTPQCFVNVPADDPLGSQAPLFYGPIQQGKDGWNAAFFCGSNAVIRREALMQLGVVPVRRRGRGRRAPGAEDRPLGARARPAGASTADDVDVRRALDEIDYDIAPGPARAGPGRGALRRHLPLPAAGRAQCAASSSTPTCARLHERPGRSSPSSSAVTDGPRRAWPPSTRPRCDQLADREWSPLGAVETVRGAGATPSTSTSAARPSR